MPVLPVLVAGALLTAGLSAQIRMTHVLEIDVANTSSGVGNNVSAVAWNGADLFVAGFNGATTAQPVAINKLTGALGPSPTWGTPFGVQAATVSNRGYMNLDIDSASGRLVAGYDPGIVDPLGITCWDLNGNLVWAKTARGSSGAAFDPGFPGGNPALGQGVAWAQFGQPGRALQDALTGADIWTVQNGMNLQVAGQGQFLRDLDFDPANGNVYIRSSNNLFFGRRTGDNATITTLLVDGAEADFVNMQNVCVLSTPAGKAILFNDRVTASVGQFWDQVILAVRPDGTPEAIDWGAFAITVPPGAAAYDFSYDRGSNTIAISDYLARKVQIFAVQVEPWYRYGAGCPGQGGFVPDLYATGSISGAAGGQVNYVASNIAPLSVGFFVFGYGMTQVPFLGPCDRLVDPLLTFYLGPVVTGPGTPGSGTFTATLNAPPGYGGNTVTTQAVVLENGSLAAIVLSNGLFLRIP